MIIFAKIPQRWMVALVAILLHGCGKSHQQTATESAGSIASTNRNVPTKAQLVAATAPDYKVQPGSINECLGRLVFDVSEPIEWPTFYDIHEGGTRSSAFSRTVRPNGGELMFGDTKISVYGPVSARLLQWVEESEPAYEAARYRSIIGELTSEILKLRKTKMSATKMQDEIADIEKDILSRKQRLQELAETYASFDPGLPNSGGYHEKTTFANNDAVPYSVFHAKLIRGNYIFIFSSTRELSEKFSKERHQQEFVTMLGKFRPRKLNEIPTDIGVCIPYGFIADEGITPGDFNQSFRWSDAPGVLYSVHTGTSSERKDKTPAITAFATAVIGRLGTAEEGEIKQFVTERIGPRTYPIGGLKASQGGVALKITESGKAAYETYNVFTGYPGFWGSEVLPFILIEMSTRTTAQAAELKQNPPPFKQSMQRFETLLKSTRLRPTNPPLPQLSD